MANLSVAIIGLGRVGASIGLALKRHMREEGKHQFDIVGHDVSSDAEKRASKMDAVDRIERKLHDAVAGRDIVVLASSYEDMRDLYRRIAGDLRDGVVVLDAAPLKRPALEWAGEFFDEEKHLVGMTPILNPKYLFQPETDVDHAEEDLFDDSAIILTPAVSAIKAAVDLAFNFCVILGAKPRFLDPTEHDMLLAYTQGLPQLLGVMLFQNLQSRPNWDDMQWLTNPTFGVLTRPLYDTHPDAIRDEWLNNRDVLDRALAEMIETLQSVRGLITQDDRASVEALLVDASAAYENWINRRHRADWDAAAQRPQVEGGNTMLSTFLGQGIANRLTGKKDDDEKK